MLTLFTKMSQELLISKFCFVDSSTFHHFLWVEKMFVEQLKKMFNEKELSFAKLSLNHTHAKFELKLLTEEFGTVGGQIHFPVLRSY